MSKAVFLEGSLMRHVAVMSATSSVGILAIFAVDFIDMIFISMLGKAELAAAIGYTGTLLFFTNSINIGLSIAAGSLVARALGAGERARARDLATSVALVAVLVSILVPIAVLWNLQELLQFLGATGETLEFAIRYSAIIVPFMAFMGIAMTSMAVLRANGDAKASMYVTLAGGVVNAALDPLFIFGLGLGLDGAAYASVAARLTMGASGLWYVIRKHDGFSRPSARVFLSDIGKVLAIAGPAVLTNLATPFGTAIVTREMAKFGTEAVAAMAVIGRLTPMAFAVVLALSGAIGPIVGQNFGAKKFDRVRGTFVAGLKFVGAYVLVATALLFLMRVEIADLFDASGEMQQLIFLFCGPLALFQFFNGAIFVCNAGFNNLGRPLYSTAVNWGRHTIGTLPFVLLGAYLAGAAGVLVGQAVGGVFFAGAAVLVAWRLTGRLEPRVEIEEFEKERRLHKVSFQRNW
ncbi:MATE family efflux transporter [Roseobacter sp. SK209-2-6]|uniref:MATE family efflux transporter n=1 Tax=Roseobacter sp. SK209-2-6 TaxID=388739 RepID=UPI000568028A|nr:MATE family efflux transporter [Roseobacter sp. SK209-2-6]